MKGRLFFGSLILLFSMPLIAQTTDLYQEPTVNPPMEPKNPLYYLQTKNLEMSVQEVNPDSILFHDFAIKEGATRAAEPSQTVVFFKSFGFLYFLDIESMELRWRTQDMYSESIEDLSQSIHQMKSVKGSSVLFMPSADRKSILCLNVLTGTQIWQTHLAAPMTTNLAWNRASEEKALFVGVEDGAIVKIDSSSGRFIEYRHRDQESQPKYISCGSGEYTLVISRTGDMFLYRAKDLSFAGKIHLNTIHVFPPILQGNRIIAYEDDNREKRIRIFNIEKKNNFEEIWELTNERIDTQIESTIVTSPTAFGDDGVAVLTEKAEVYLFKIDTNARGASKLSSRKVPLNISVEPLSKASVLLPLAAGTAAGNEQRNYDYLIIDRGVLIFLSVDESLGIENISVVKSLFRLEEVFDESEMLSCSPVIQVYDDNGVFIPVIDQDSGTATLAKIEYLKQRIQFKMESAVLYSHGKVFQTDPIAIEGGKLVFLDQYKSLQSLSIVVDRGSRSFQMNMEPLSHQSAETPAGMHGIEKNTAVLLVHEARLSLVDPAKDQVSSYLLPEEDIRILPYIAHTNTGDDTVFFCTSDRELHAVRFLEESGVEVTGINPRLPVDIFPSADYITGLVVFEEGDECVVIVSGKKGLIAYVFQQDPQGDVNTGRQNPAVYTAEFIQIWRHSSSIDAVLPPVLYEEGFTRGGGKSALLYQVYKDGRVVGFDVYGQYDKQDNGISDRGHENNPSSDIVSQYFLGIADTEAFGVNNYFLVVASGNHVYLFKRNAGSEISEELFQTRGKVDGLFVYEDLICVADDSNRISFIQVGVHPKLDFRYNVQLQRTCGITPLELEGRFFLIQTVDGRVYLFDPDPKGKL